MIAGMFVSYSGEKEPRYGVYLAPRSEGQCKVVLTKGEDDVEFLTVPESQVAALDLADSHPQFGRLKSESHIASLVSRYCPPGAGGADLNKASAAQMTAGLVKRLVPVKGGAGKKSYFAIRMVSPETFAKVAEKRRRAKEAAATARGDDPKQREIRLNEANVWYKHLTDGLADVYPKIQEGNAEALAKFLFQKFFTKDAEAHETLAQRITRSIPRSPVEGFEMEDLLQETMYRALRDQAKGGFKDKEARFFPAVIARYMVNVGRDLKERANREQQKGKYQRLASDISDMADDLSALADTPEEAYITSETIVQAKKDFDDIHKAVKKALHETARTANKERAVSIYNSWISGKEQTAIGEAHGMSGENVAAVIHRAKGVIEGELKRMGYAPNVNSFRSASRELTAHAAKIPFKSFRVKKEGGKLILKAVSERPPLTHGVYRGLSIVIENPAGSVRHGRNQNGTPWETLMRYPYGYIQAADGADDEGVDCYVGPDETAREVYVIHQQNPFDGGSYDEDKIMLGFSSPDAARAAYELHYDRPDFFGGMTSMRFEDFYEAMQEGISLPPGVIMKAQTAAPGALVQRQVPVHRQTGTNLETRMVNPNQDMPGQKMPGQQQPLSTPKSSEQPQPVPAPGASPTQQPGAGGGQPSPNPTQQQQPNPAAEKLKQSVKTALRSFIDAMVATLKGQSGAAVAAQGAEQTGAQVAEAGKEAGKQEDAQGKEKPAPGQPEKQTEVPKKNDWEGYQYETPVSEEEHRKNVAEHAQNDVEHHKQHSKVPAGAGAK